MPVLLILLSLLVLISPGSAHAQGFQETPLASGVPSSFTIPALASPTLLCCFRIEVPAGATRLEVRLAAPAGVQFANVVRFGVQPIPSPLTASYPVVIGNNPLVITRTSSPPLGGGTYFIGTLVVASPGGQTATMTATVTTEAPPRISASVTNLNFTATAGSNPPSQTFTVRNSGGGTLNFSIASSEARVTASPASGSVTTQSITITVSVNAIGLPAGVYEASLRITAPGADPVTITGRLQLNAAPPATSALTSVSAASLTAATAPDSIVSAFGQNLAASVAVPESADLPEQLEGVTVRVTDSQGRERPGRLFFVAPGQINFLLDAATALGTATARVHRNGQLVAQGTLLVERVAPAVFTANANGRGVAAAQVLRIRPDGSQTLDVIFQCQAAGNCTAVPIDPTGDDLVFLLIYGTGLRGRSGASAVSATLGGEAVETSDAVAQGQFLGLDQVNVRLQPRLAGRGAVDLILRVDGRAANTVTVHLGGQSPAPPPPTPGPSPTGLPPVPSGRAYQPVAAGMEWAYRVTFPQTARVPHRPIVEQPEGLLCSNVFCGLQTWNAGQIEFRVIASEMVSSSGNAELWNATITDRGAEFFFPTSGPVQIRRRQITDTQLELVQTPAAGLRLVRPLSRPNQGSLISGIISPETITVPAGTFRNVVTAETVLTGDATSGFTGTYRTEIKLAPYVGIIRAIMRDPNGQVVFTQELTRFSEPSPLPAPRFRISNPRFGQTSFTTTPPSTQIPIELDFEDPSASSASGFLTILSNLDGAVAGFGTLRAQGVTSGQTSGSMRITAGIPGLRLISGRTYVFTFVLRNENGDESNPLSGSFTAQ
jgi:uncharacterized protein (TIGR03437 family)